CSSDLAGDVACLVGRQQHIDRRQFDRSADRYASSLDWVMARGRMTMVVFAGTSVATGSSFMVIPKNSFPEQDTGQIAVTTSAGQDVSYARMAALQQQVAQASLANPAVGSSSSSIGVDGQNATLSQGRMSVNSKGEGQRGDLDTVSGGVDWTKSGTSRSSRDSVNARIGGKSANERVTVA
ncbi:hypothetical protein OY671_010292, partial [Metschnikowia pulcherrima]